MKLLERRLFSIEPCKLTCTATLITDGCWFRKCFIYFFCIKINKQNKCWRVTMGRLVFPLWHWLWPLIKRCTFLYVGGINWCVGNILVNNATQNLKKEHLIIFLVLYENLHWISNMESVESTLLFINIPQEFNLDNTIIVNNCWNRKNVYFMKNFYATWVSGSKECQIQIYRNEITT